MSRLWPPLTGRARVIGITGPPGVGKSTLIGAMAERLSQRGEGLWPSWP
ncbi:hypothetical protein [Thermogymnomonas acidicola]|nr:nucleoside-triphosphatase [Thermogymnomonas acidicola]